MSSNPLNKLNRHLLRQALDALPTAAFIVEAQSRERLILLANGAAGDLAGFSPPELVGRSMDGLLVEGPAPDSGEPWVLRSSAGTPVNLSAAPLYTSPGAPACWLLTVTDQTLRQSLPTVPAGSRAAADPAGPEPAAARPAARSYEPGATGTFSVTDSWMRMRDERNDPATGVLSRSAFLEFLGRDLRLAERIERPVSLMVFRVDGVDTYQGLFGRHATDACLRKVAHAISTSLRRGSDCCGRTNQDQFMVLSAGGDPAATAEFAARIAQRVRDLAIHHPRSGNGRYVTVSWGLVVTGPGSPRGEAAVLAAAEADLERRALALPASAASTA